MALSDAEHVIKQLNQSLHSSYYAGYMRSGEIDNIYNLHE